MKTLKKTLCLVLAVVMAVGVLVLPANAAKKDYDGFDDTDKITPAYKVAVATLTGMGIINGKGTGFDPQGGLTRGEAMQLIVKALVGDDMQYLAPGQTSFTDVPADYFGATAISYATANRIAAGKSTTSFKPNDPVTGYELARWLLVATEAKTDFDPAIWQSQTGTAASRSGFLKGLSINGSLNTPLNREQAAQMIWNAIRFSPEGDTVTYVVFKDKNDDGILDSGETVVKETSDAIEALTLASIKGNALTTRTSYANSIAGRQYNLEGETNNSSDDFRRPTTKYVNGVTGTVYSDVGTNYVAVLNGPVTGKEVLAALGEKEDATIEVTAYEDGQVKAFDEGVKKDTKVATRGATVEVYDDGTLVIINTYATVVPEVKDGKFNVTVKVGEEDKTVAVDAGALVKGNVISYNVSYKNDPKVLNAAALTGIEGVINGKSGNTSFKVNGETRYLAANAIDIDANNGHLDMSGITVSAAPCIFYYHSGNVIAKAAKKAETVAPTYQYVYVLAVATQAGTPENGGTGSDDLVITEQTGEPEKPAKAVARIVDLATGTIRDVNLGIFKDGSGASAKWYLSDKNGKKPTNATEIKDNTGSSMEAGFYCYDVTPNGDYVLNTFAGATKADTVTTTKGSAVVNVGTQKYATTGTSLVLLSLKTKDGKITGYNVKTYNGYQNFDKIVADDSYQGEQKKATGGYYVTNDDGTLANVVVFGKVDGSGTTETKAAKDWYIFTGVGEQVLNADGTTSTQYNFLHNGVAVTLTGLDGNSGDAFTLSADVKAKDVVEVTFYDNGNIRSVTKYTGENEKLDMTVAVYNANFIADETNIRYLGKGVWIYDAVDGKVVDTVKAGYKVTVYEMGTGDSNDNTVTLIVITDHNGK